MLYLQLQISSKRLIQGNFPLSHIPNVKNHSKKLLILHCFSIFSPEYHEDNYTYIQPSCS